MFDNYIENLKDQIINSTCELINIPSVYSDNSNSTMPFGEDCNKALEYMLNLGESLGFRVKNVDGYCGYIEFGQGDELMGIIGHLDVVPVDDTWSYDPFSATIKENKIFGRGAIDDKGPVIATLYAMKAVMDNYVINKRVRLILGLNEERDWKCIDYYKNNEEIPNFGFSPDADFPCIYAEKALLNVHLFQDYDSNDKIKISHIDFGNNAMNVVPKFCEIQLLISNEINIAECINSLKSIVKSHNFNIEIENNADIITLKSYGISSHSAHPDLGKNAISPIIITLYEILHLYSLNIDIITFFRHYIHMQYNGDDLQLGCCDESGKLTLNVARFSLEKNKLTISMNLRIPVHTSIDTVKSQFNKLLAESSIDISYDGEKDALYIPKDNELITTLCNIFNESTGLNTMPIAIGGATYARAFPNCVSFGANMPNCEDMCHKADEFISIDNLILSAKIYANVIYKLTV